ncbi:VCAM1 protein, partial [Polyodon spathula]|nr:VCAM1 protein [Polyodon spathula]
VQISPANNPLNVFAGSKLSLACSTTMTCSTPLIYMWWKPPGKDVNTRILNLKTFEFHEVKTEDEGEYICKVVCGDKKMTKKVRVQVISFNEPVIHVPEPLKEGIKVDATCKVENINPDGMQVRIEWMLGTQVLRNTSHTSDNHFTDTLTIQPKKENHGQNLRCIVTLDVFQKEHSVELHVNYGPKNTSISASPGIDIPEGGSLQLTCKTQSNPEVTQYKWKRLPEASLPRGVLVEGSSLTIHRFQGYHQGIYECEAIHLSGKRDRAYITVTVTQGNSLTIHCCQCYTFLCEELVNIY